MPPLNILIKPASGNCNLRCKYCFYYDLTENRNVQSYGMMNEDTLEVIVKKALEYSEGFCTIAFQGGEPTIIGLDFFKKLIEFQKKYNKNNVVINNSIQTNGTLINEEWAEFLSKNKFLVGLSLDGTKDIHDFNRVDSKGMGTFNRIQKTVDLFNKYHVEYNILFVVTKNTARYAEKIYNFFKKNNFRYIQPIPCLDPLMDQKGSKGYSLDAVSYEKFLKTFFDKWYEDVVKGDYVSIRYFDNLINMLLGYPPEACNMNGRCSCQCVIEADGGVYPCDFYVIDEWYIGNIKEKNFDELIKSEKTTEFIEKSLNVPEECKECKWYPLCRNGCRRERENIEGKIELNFYCEAYKNFFQYAYERLVHVARLAQMRLR